MKQRKSLGALSDKRVHIHGQRFDADISPSRARADIKDLERETMLTMLETMDIAELAVISFEALSGVSWGESSAIRFRPRGHPDRDGVDIYDLKTRKRLGGLDRKALEELQLLASELVEMMTGK